MKTTPDTDARRKLIDFLIDAQSRANDNCTEFVEYVKADPHRALDNCDQAFAHASWVHIAGAVIKALTTKDSKATVLSIRDHAYEQAHRLAKWPTRSTSVTASLLSQYDGATWTEIYEFTLTLVGK